jgi:hypothetical protein
LDIDEVVELLPQTEVAEGELDTDKLELLLHTEDFDSVSWSNILERFNAVDAGFVPTTLQTRNTDMRSDMT